MKIIGNRGITKKSLAHHDFHGENIGKTMANHGTIKSFSEIHSRVAVLSQTPEGSPCRGWRSNAGDTRPDPGWPSPVP